MHRKLRRASRLLSAAVALGGLAGQAAAQFPGMPPKAGKPEPTQSAPSPQTPTTAPNPAQARWAEINVEVAVLADEMTFPGQIAAHVAGAQLELSGVVSCETARQRAVQLARIHGTLPVKDSLKIQAGLAVKTTSGSTTPVSTAAGNLLSDRLREKAHGLEVFCPTEGTVVIRGAVGSFEDKLAISQLLRQTPGCKAVVNETTVAPVPYQGKYWNKVTRDGKLTVAAASQTESPFRVAESDAAKTPATQTTTTVTTTTATGTTSESKTTTKVQPVAYQAPSTGVTTTQTTAPVTTTDYRLVPVPTTTTSSTGTTSTTTSGTTVQPAQAAPSQQKPMGGLLSRLLPFGSKGDIGTPQPQPTPSYPDSSKIVSQTMGSPTSATPVPTYAGGTLLTSAPGAGKTPQRTVNGVVIFDGPPVTPNPKTILASQGDLKRRVETVTAGQAREVAVVASPEGNVTIKFTVSSHAAEKELREKVLEFPEMKSPNMRLEITIMEK